MIRLKSDGKYVKTAKYLDSISGKSLSSKEYELLTAYGDSIVRRLQDMTPKDTGLTAASWYYTIVKDSDTVRLVICNSNRSGGYSIALLIQYGHGTGSGAYVPGIDYINPAVKPYFDKIQKDLWKEVAD